MIVFSGKQLIAHWHEGQSDFLLVSFNQLNHEHTDSEDFFLRPQVEHAKIACIGVMTVEKAFYLSPEITEIARLVAEKRAGRKVVVFGQSMGAYAAIKFSALLQADFVIALSPFYSVHADDLEISDDRHLRILMHTMARHGVPDRPEFAGMAIRDADTSGRLVVVYDPAELIDNYAATLIAKHVPRVEIITVPHAGHVIYDSRWSAKLLEDFLLAVQSPDQAAMRRTVTMLRRNQIAFLTRTLLKAANRKPRLCASAMNARRIRLHPDYRSLIADPLNLRAIYLLTERGDHAHAEKHLALVMRACYELDIKPSVWAANDTAADILARDRCLVLSVHGAFLCWDRLRGLARFEPHPFNSSSASPIVVSLRDRHTVIEAITDGIGKSVTLFESDEANPQPGQETIEIIDNNQVALRRGHLYLGSMPHGGTYELDGITHEQRFVILPLQPPSKLFERKQVSWFDQVEHRQAAVSVATNTPVVQRKNQRWRKLFGKG